MDGWINSLSLYRTVVRAADFLFKGGSFSDGETEALTAHLLANTHRVKGFVYYLTDAEREQGIRLISGEKPRTLLLANNAVELETLRLLALLAPDLPAVQALFLEADRRLEKLCFARVCTVGECAGASIAYLRYLTMRGVEAYREKIERGLAAVKQDRKGNGQWQHFPYRFTARWLMELPASLGVDEREYAAGRGRA